jgi:hypothetical protein
MKRSLLLTAVFLVVATPTWAAPFSVPGCAPGTFTIIAQTKVGFEQGPTVLEGNVLVTKDDGFAQFGAHNRIKGTVIADKIFLGTGAVVDTCVADSITGPGICTTVGGTFSAAPAACKVFSFTPPTIGVCANTGLLINVPAGQTETLAPGCYGIIRVGLGATLQLESGVYVARELRLLTGATLDGADTGARSRVLVRTATITAASRLLHVDILTANTAGDFAIGNSVELTDVQAITAASGIHLHTGFVGDNFGIAAQNVIVEPGQGKGGESEVCACRTGFHLPPFTPAQQCFPD